MEKKLGNCESFPDRHFFLEEIDAASSLVFVVIYYTRKWSLELGDRCGKRL